TLPALQVRRFNGDGGSGDNPAVLVVDATGDGARRTLGGSYRRYGSSEKRRKKRSPTQDRTSQIHVSEAPVEKHSRTIKASEVPSLAILSCTGGGRNQPFLHGLALISRGTFCQGLSALSSI